MHYQRYYRYYRDMNQSYICLIYWYKNSKITRLVVRLNLPFGRSYLTYRFLFVSDCAAANIFSSFPLSILVKVPQFGSWIFNLRQLPLSFKCWYNICQPKPLNWENRYICKDIFQRNATQPETKMQKKPVKYRYA